MDYIPAKFLSDAEPNAVGEFLRDLFFDQKYGQEVGCYTTFNVRPYVKQEPDEIEIEQDFPEVWKVYSYAGIKMSYYWEGDGCLTFEFSDGRILSNNDCKKGNRWEWVVL